MSTSDALGLAGLVVGLLSLVVTGVGFGFTIAGLKRTATAAEASNALLASVGRRMQHNHLLVMLPQLHVIADELDSAVLSDDAKGASRALVAYSRVSLQIAAILESGEDGEDALAARLRTSSTSASAAKGQIVTGTRVPLQKLLRGLLHEVTAISSEAGALAGKYQMRVT